MKNQIDEIEIRLRSWIESSAEILPWGKLQGKLARRLVEAMQNALVEDSAGKQCAPNLYTIFLNPANPLLESENTAMPVALAHALQNSAHQAEIHFVTQPVIVRIESMPSLASDDLQVSACVSLPMGGETAVIPTGVESNTLPAQGEHYAYLVINGTRTVPLRQPVINIGRRSDNHLVIDDPRVSRVHAQIRLVKQRYTLFDLNSTGGTWVNSRRITGQHSLKPGDVISLAGVPLIYGEENAPQIDDTRQLKGAVEE